jgi:hypothetical protein
VWLRSDRNRRVLPAAWFPLPDEYKDGPGQAQKSGVGREDIAERQPLFCQTCLHGRGSDLATKLQRTVRPEEVVMAAQQLQMIFQPLLPPRMTKAPTTEVGRALPDGQVQTFDVGSPIKRDVL